MASGVSNPIPLTTVSKSQINKILRKLQLVAPTAYDVDGRIDLLWSSVVFNNGLGEYDKDDILVKFNKGEFIDFVTADGNFDGLFPRSSKSGKVLYPCQVCAAEVTDRNDTSGLGIQCDGCGMFFHNSCTSKPLTKVQFDAITESPSYVKVLCPPCNRVYGSADLKLKVIDKKVTTTANKVCFLAEQIDDMVSKPSYSAAASRNSVPGKAHDQKLTRNLVKSLTDMTKETRENQNAEKLKRTRIVLRPQNTQIRTSRDIRKEFNTTYKGMIIKHCRLTASGSITFEFENEETAIKVHEDWSTNYYGGNLGMRKPGQSNTTGIIKHVYDDLTEDDMRNEIMENYKDDIDNCEFLKRKADNSFMGLIKVAFKSREKLQKAIDDKIILGDQRYIVEEYRRRSRVIKCNKCQGWGHVHRYCNRSAKCGKCAGNHETTSCAITTGFKCAHCGKDHQAGSNDCAIYKEKLAKFSVSNLYD